MIVELAIEAQNDLEEIGNYIARDDPARAIGFLGELRDKCSSLADMPNRFPLLPRYERHDIRHCSHGNYLIFYRVAEDRVTVIHILHGARDYASILFPA